MGASRVNPVATASNLSAHLHAFKGMLIAAHRYLLDHDLYVYCLI